MQVYILFPRSRSRHVTVGKGHKLLVTVTAKESKLCVGLKGEEGEKVNSCATVSSRFPV